MSTSVLDERGDVHLFTNGANQQVFRDGVCHGLTLAGGDLFRNGHLVVRIRSHGGDYVAAWMPSGHVAARHDTRYGLIAKVARMLLHPATCCKGNVQ